MDNNLNRLLRKYYWMPIVALAVLGSWWLGIRAWDYLTQPILLDIIWNETLHIYEPIYFTPSYPEWVNAIMLVPAVFLMWWSAPVYFQIPYALAFLYSLLLAWGYYPCIDVPSGRVPDEA